MSLILFWLLYNESYVYIHKRISYISSDPDYLWLKSSAFTFTCPSKLSNKKFDHYSLLMTNRIRNIEDI